MILYLIFYKFVFNLSLETFSPLLRYEQQSTQVEMISSSEGVLDHTAAPAAVWLDETEPLGTNELHFSLIFLKEDSILWWAFAGSMLRLSSPFDTVALLLPISVNLENRDRPAVMSFTVAVLVNKLHDISVSQQSH